MEYLKVAELKPPTCKEIQPLIPNIVREKLSPVQRGTVFAHFLHCPQCAGEYHTKLEEAIAAGEVQLPQPTRDPLELARERLKQREAGISILWSEIIKEKESQWANEKKVAIIEALIVLAKGWLSRRPVRRIRGPKVSKTNVISADLLNANLQPSGEKVRFEIRNIPQFTEDGRFCCELETDELCFEGYTVSLTILSEGKPVVTFTAKLLKTEGKPEKLEAIFSEDGFDEIPSSSVPLEKDIKFQVFPML